MRKLAGSLKDLLFGEQFPARSDSVITSLPSHGQVKRPLRTRKPLARVRRRSTQFVAGVTETFSVGPAMIILTNPEVKKKN